MVPTDFALFCSFLILFQGNAAGRNNPNLDQKPIPAIVGGTNAVRGEFPYQGMLYITKDFKIYICGCSLLNPKWAVTAAHCTDGGIEDTLKVYFGKVIRPNIYSSAQYSVYKVHQHPFYTGKAGGHHHDVSLLHMLNEVEINKFVSPIALPYDGEILPEGKICSVAGWGHESAYSTRLPQIMQKAKVSIVSNLLCRELLTSKDLKSLFPEQMCAGYLPGGIGACQGDSGGALACTLSSGIAVLQGIVSLVVPCANFEKPDIYTRVSSYVDWIETTMGEDAKLNIVVQRNETPDGKPFATQRNSAKNPNFPFSSRKTTAKGNNVATESRPMTKYYIFLFIVLTTAFVLQ